MGSIQVYRAGALQYADVLALAELTDGGNGQAVPPAGLVTFNGSTWDRWRGNQEGTLLASAARTVEAASPNQTNYNARGVVVYLNITAASGTGGLLVRLAGVDPITGAPMYINPDVTPISAVGRYGFELCPGASSAPVGGNSYIHQRVAGVLPRTWQARVVPADGSSYTYSLAYALAV